MTILTINPGSTSTRLVLFEDEKELSVGKLNHDQDEIFQKEYSKPGVNVFEQFEYRLKEVEKFLEDAGVEKLDAVVGRGGMMKPIEGGTYHISDEMINDMRERPLANHASNLGAPLAVAIAEKYGIKEKAFIVDPVVTDEMLPKNKLTGVPSVKRYAAWHALNQKSVARNYAKDNGKEYSDVNVIVAHMGGGASFGAHRKGRVINVYNALSGEGPFTPERAGSLPVEAVVEMCFSQDYSREEIMYLVAGGGGMFAHLGTKDLREFVKGEAWDKTPQEKKDVIDAMIAGYSRAICSLIPDFEGEKIDAIVLTGGFAHEEFVVNTIKEDLSAIQIPIAVYPGEKEMEAMRDGALRVLLGEEEAKKY